MNNILDALLKGEVTVDTSKKNIANSHSNQANDSATQIISYGNPNDAKAKLALKIADLEKEKLDWIDNELKKYGPLGSTGAIVKSIHMQANTRYDATLASLRKTLNEL